MMMKKSVVCIFKGPCFIFATNLTQTYLKWNDFLIEYVYCVIRCASRIMRQGACEVVVM